MSEQSSLPLGVALTADIEARPGVLGTGYRARVRWRDPATRRRCSRSETFPDRDEAEAWIDKLRALSSAGVDPATATQGLQEYGESIMPLALRDRGDYPAPTTASPHKSSLPGRPSVAINRQVDMSIHPSVEPQNRVLRQSLHCQRKQGRGAE